MVDFREEMVCCLDAESDEAVANAWDNSGEVLLEPLVASRLQRLRTFETRLGIRFGIFSCR